VPQHSQRGRNTGGLCIGNIILPFLFEVVSVSTGLAHKKRLLIQEWWALPYFSVTKKSLPPQRAN